MTSQTIIISDTHLGDPRSASPRAADLLPLIDRADALVINGDTAELQRPSMRGQAAREVLELRLLCDRLGTELQLISGNHDAYIDDCRYRTYARDTVLVTHGDVLHPAVVPWAADRKEMAQETKRFLDEMGPNDRESLEGRLETSRHVSHLEFLRASEGHTEQPLLRSPSRLLEVLKYWYRVPQLANRFAEQYLPDARFIVIGHSHRHGIWQVGDRTVINTGSFHWPGRPRATVIQGDEIRVHPISRRPDRLYDLQPSPIFSAALGTLPAWSLEPHQDATLLDTPAPTKDLASETLRRAA